MADENKNKELPPEEVFIDEWRPCVLITSGPGGRTVHHTKARYRIGRHLRSSIPNEAEQVRAWKRKHGLLPPESDAASAGS